MKKIIYLFLVLIILFSAKDVFAEEYKLTLEKQNGIYFSRKGENFNDDSYPYYLYKFGDIFAYCIEPGKHISTYTYIEEDYVDLGFSDELKEKLELIGYYGRDYPGHDNIRYSMATQALVWELTGVDKVTYWTKQNEEGDEIDITNERDEIMRLVNAHKTLPDFKKYYQVDLNQTFEIRDNNNVLNTYEVVNNENIDVNIDNNTLVINPKKIGNFNIKLSKKNYNEYKTIIFVGKKDSSTQKIARLHFNKEIDTTLNVDVKGIKLLVNKVDENNNLVKTSNIKFKIRDLTREIDVCEDNNCIYQTNEKGFFTTHPLDYGEYEIEELEDQITPGYTWNKEKIHVYINDNRKYKYDKENGNYLEIYFKNHRVKGSLELIKMGEKAIFNNNEVNYSQDNLKNVEFSLYTIDNNYVTTIVTDNNGYATINDLALGKYYLLEKSDLNDYIKMDKLFFEIEQKNQYQENINVSLKVVNYLKKGKLEFSKEDFITGVGIPNTIIEIYDNGDRLIFTKKTDENGKVVIDDLPVGKYYIVEKEANSLYKITNEKVYFEIKENDEIVKARMTNEKIEIPVPKTNTKEDIIAHTIFGICFLIGIGRMYYEKKSY